MRAHTITNALNGTWHNHYGTAPCPVCQPERRSDQRALSIRDGEGLLRFEVFCHGEGCKSEEIVSTLFDYMALGSHSAEAHHFFPPREETPLERAARIKEQKGREEQAHRIWNEAQPLLGSPGEAYLRSLDITCPLPDNLRYHGSCWHPWNAPRPAIVSLVGYGGEGFAASYLPVPRSIEVAAKPADAYLGPVGSAVPIIELPPEAKAPFIVAESIESALALASADVLPGPVNILAAVTVEGLAGLWLPSEDHYGWNLPVAPGRVTIVPDGGARSRKAGHLLANRAMAARWDANVLPASEGSSWTDLPVGLSRLTGDALQEIRERFQQITVSNRGDVDPDTDDQF